MIEIIIMKIMKVKIVSQFKVPSQILSFSMVGWFLWFFKICKKSFYKSLKNMLFISTKTKQQNI